MPEILKDIYQILTAEQKRKLFFVQIFLFGTSIMELAGVSSIAPYLAVVADPGLIQSNAILAEAHGLFDGISDRHFLLYLGLVILLFIFVSGIFSITGSWIITKFSQFTGQELAIRLYKYYLNRSYLFHTRNNSSVLMSNITQETNRVTFYVLQPLMRINAKLIIVVLIIGGLLVLDPFLASIAAGSLFICYLLIYKGVKTALHRYGKTITKANAIRFRAMNEGFGGIKELKLLNKEEYYAKGFASASLSVADVMTKNQVVSIAPKYMLEVIAFGGILSIILYLLFTHGNFTDVLPILSLYAIAGFKLLPAFQQIYGGVTSLRVGKSALDEVKKELKQALLEFGDDNDSSSSISSGDIELRGLSFCYPDADKNVFDNLNLTIRKNSTVGIAGSSGAGKTTLVDIILGLITPNEGELIIGGEVIYKGRIRSWQTNVGYVPQFIFLADTSIASNIALGTDPSDIDVNKLSEVIEMASLSEFIETLPDGIDTIVGERGAQLSGGQRQRIGIARALYNDASVLVLDEATSALDGVMESEVMQAIAGLYHKKTVIIVAHRLTTLKICDTIFFFENGKIVEQGNYEHLITNNKTFLKMANI